MGIFMSEFLIVTSTMARDPWLAVPLVSGLLVGFGALLRHINSIAFGEPLGSDARGRILPAYVWAPGARAGGRNFSTRRARASVSGHSGDVGVSTNA